MADIIFKKASLTDMEVLLETRIEVLQAVFGVSKDTDMTDIRAASLDYYKDSLAKDMHVAYLVFDRQGEAEIFAGAGGISFYQVMPTCSNPTGWCAYVMNMYTRPEYRGQGIAGQTLELLVHEAKERGITHISLSATKMGRPVYEKHSFVQMAEEMEYQESKEDC